MAAHSPLRSSSPGWSGGRGRWPGRWGSVPGTLAEFSPRLCSHQPAGGMNPRLRPLAWTSVSWAVPLSAPATGGDHHPIGLGWRTSGAPETRSPRCSGARPIHTDGSLSTPSHGILVMTPRPAEGRAGWPAAHLPGLGELLQAAGQRAVRQHHLIAGLVVIGAQKAGGQACGAGTAGRAMRACWPGSGAQPDPASSKADLPEHQPWL